MIREMLEEFQRGINLSHIRDLLTQARAGEVDIPADEIDNMTYEELLERYPNNPIPASSSAVAELPVYSHEPASAGLDSGTSGTSVDVQDCSVCLESFQKSEILKVLPCLHRFHADCIDNWLRRNGNCPICKHRL